MTYSCQVINGDRLQWDVTLSNGATNKTEFSIPEARQGMIQIFSILNAVFEATLTDIDERNLESTLFVTLTGQLDQATVMCSHDSGTFSSDSETIAVIGIRIYLMSHCLNLSTKCIESSWCIGSIGCYHTHMRAHSNTQTHTLQVLHPPHRICWSPAFSQDLITQFL